MTVLPTVPSSPSSLEEVREPDDRQPAAPTTVVVLDTSALVADPDALHAFPGADVVIPLTVIEELDHLKARPDDVGWAARTVLRRIEELRVGHGGDIRLAVPLDHGGTIRVEPNGLHLSELSEHGLATDRPDNRILAAALGQAVHAPVTVVSNDAALRIKAAQLGLEAMEHQRLRGRRVLRGPIATLSCPSPRRASPCATTASSTPSAARRSSDCTASRRST